MQKNRETIELFFRWHLSYVPFEHMYCRMVVEAAGEVSSGEKI